MVYPFNTNKIEQLAMDPEVMINGIIWFNSTDKVYKAYIDETLHIFLTDASFISRVESLVDQALQSTHFTLAFNMTTSIIVKHNKNTKHFNYQLFDTIANESVNASLDIIDENEVRLDFADPMEGTLFMHFA